MAMNDHAGWTRDLKCVLCGSDDSSKPSTGLPEEYEKTGSVRILESEGERILREIQTVAKFDNEIIKQIKEVKEYVAKVCEQTLQEHECNGVVPGTFIVCGEGDYQYCSNACLKIASMLKDIQEKNVEHSLNCGWHQDWHSCSCGMFDKNKHITRNKR
jgi:hypothetical protein